MVWLLLLAFMALTILLALLTKNHISIRLSIEDTQVYLRIQLYLLGELIKRDYYLSHDQGNVQTNMHRSKKKKKSFTGWTASALSKCKAVWSVFCQIGTQDAAQTAILCGLLGTILKSGAAFLASKVPCQRQHFLVIPRLDKASFVFHFRCMITIQTGTIVMVVLKNTIRRFWRR